MSSRLAPLRHRWIAALAALLHAYFFGVQAKRIKVNGAALGFPGFTVVGVGERRASTPVNSSAGATGEAGNIAAEIGKAPEPSGRGPSASVAAVLNAESLGRPTQATPGWTPSAAVAKPQATKLQKEKAQVAHPLEEHRSAEARPPGAQVDYTVGGEAAVGVAGAQLPPAQVVIQNLSSNDRGKAKGGTIELPQTKLNEGRSSQADTTKQASLQIQTRSEGAAAEGTTAGSEVGEVLRNLTDLLHEVTPPRSENISKQEEPAAFAERTRQETNSVVAGRGRRSMAQVRTGSGITVGFNGMFFAIFLAAAVLGGATFWGSREASAWLAMRIAALRRGWGA